MFRKKMFAIALIGIFCNVANAGKLEIRVEKPDLVKIMNRNSAWNIILEGEIDTEAPERVARALATTANDGADVFISSPGGSLLAGIQIGRLIRKYGGNTHVGSLNADPTLRIGSKTAVKITPGGCYSACSLAFLGGVYRYISDESVYGVHRFSNVSGPKSSDLDTAQVISATINNYIREMDVNPSLFDLMVQAGKDNMRILNKEEIRNLQVANNGRKKAEWSVEVVEGGQYLRGVQDTVYGEGKATFACDNGKMMMQSFYQIGATKAAEVMAGNWHHSLLIDGEVVKLPRRIAAKATGDEIFNSFLISKDIALQIGSAQRVGHAMQMAPDAPTFVGYEIDILPPFVRKVSTFIRNCYR